MAALLAFSGSSPVFVAHANPVVDTPTWKSVLERVSIMSGMQFAAAAGAGVYQIMGWVRRLRLLVEPARYAVPLAGLRLLALPAAPAGAHFGTSG